jgi:hypothetical protein
LGHPSPCRHDIPLHALSLLSPVARCDSHPIASNPDSVKIVLTDFTGRREARHARAPCPQRSPQPFIPRSPSQAGKAELFGACLRKVSNARSMRPPRCRACGSGSHNGCCELAVDLFVQVHPLIHYHPGTHHPEPRPLPQWQARQKGQGGPADWGIQVKKGLTMIPDTFPARLFSPVPALPGLASLVTLFSWSQDLVPI